MLYEHVDTAVIDGESLPWVPFTPYAENVLMKYFKLDPIRGEVVLLMKAPLDMQLPRHHHTGAVMVYTIQGKWKYKEHDWVAGPGSIVYETANRPTRLKSSGSWVPVALRCRPQDATGDVRSMNLRSRRPRPTRCSRAR